MRWLVIDGCPCPPSIAPYVYIVLRDAGQSANSIYRGEDAKAILHRHGKHTQGEIHRSDPLISNPEGFSQHELRDEHGNRLPPDKIGVDSGKDTHHDKVRIDRAAQSHGWTVHHPYKRGVEGHHWQFLHRPRPHSLRMRLRIIHLRATLPRK